ncbi:PREDICTED: uncharacterized protein LOC104604469 [Nelumbo nucifera]|uniref:Uncharacterized protein LOC104604469 n=1 Tax=Nelumbo nucifera TaxID=4432 RepID=A0A1U8AM28_NELNU|nr:PREDICTED: uncharacterized protein LOC104604469 [Nelumbo nucifera]
MMGEGRNQNFRGPILTAIHSFPPSAARHDQWAAMDGDDDVCDSSSTASSFEDSANSIASSSSLDFTEDASSSSSSSPPPPVSKGPLYELSELMAQLPIKRGLSKHYQGKSQSFTSLSNVRCIEDLIKKVNPYKKKMKSSKSYGGLDTNKSYTPKAFISKKTSRSSFSLLGKRNSFMGC